MTPAAHGRVTIGLALLLGAALLSCSAGSTSSDLPGGNPGTGGSTSSGSGGASSGGASGSGGSSAGSGGASGTGGSAAQDASADAPSDASDASQRCFLNLVPLTASFGDEVEWGTTFRVRGEASPPHPDDQWAWTVTDPNGNPVMPQIVNADTSVIQFPLAVNIKGTYGIVARIPGRADCAAVPRGVVVVAPRPASFVFRVFPPEDSGAAIQDFRLTRSQLMDRPLLLSAEVRTVHIFPYDDMAHELPSYVQITSPGSGLVLEGNTAHGATTVLLLDNRTYDLLVIPAGDFAPKVISGLPSVLAGTLTLDAGITVSGHMLRADGSPIADARVVLRNGNRPSTIGTSGADGRFSLRTREGKLSIEIAAPPASGLPDARVTAATGLNIDRASPEVTLDMQWADIPRTSLKVTVHAPDGTTAVGRATVMADLLPTAQPIGTLTARIAGAATPLATVGARHAEAVADSTGIAIFAALPQGSYQLTVVPPPAAGDAGAAITSGPVALTAASINKTVTLAPKIKVSGVLNPTAGTKGVRLSALDTGADLSVAAVSTVVDENGQFELTVNPGRGYKLWAEPPPGQPFARAVIATVPAATADRVLPASTLPTATATTSQVMFAAGVPGALVRVFCAPNSSLCGDAPLPIAETITDLTGKFTVMLPDAAASAASGTPSVKP